MTHLIRRAARRAPALLVTVVALMAVAPAALAHVTVSSPDAVPGGFGKLVFRVPTESATTSTVQLTVTLPTATPFAEVSARALPGWSIRTTETRLVKPIKFEGFTLTKAVSTVTWTARAGQGVAPGQFEEFELSAGPFPTGTDLITLPVVQTYSDGSVVTWNQPTPASGIEPEHPMPTLELKPADGSVRPVSNTTSAPRGAGTDGLARWLGGVGLGLAVVALVIAIRPMRRRTA